MVAPRQELARAIGDAQRRVRYAKDRRRKEHIIHQGNAAEVDLGHRVGGGQHRIVFTLDGRREKAQVRRIHRPRGADQTVGLGEFGDAGDVAAPVGKVLAGENARAIVPGVCLIGDADLAIEVDALKVLFQNDVDGARDGVRAIDRSAADRHRFDAIDQLGRNHVEVDLLAGSADRIVWTGAVQARRARRHETASVDEHQGALRTQAV